MRFFYSSLILILGEGMKTLITGTIALIVIGILSFIKLDFHPFIKNDDKSIITIKYKNEETKLDIEPYETIETILKRIEINEDVDLSTLNPNQILKHRDVLVLPIKTIKVCISINNGSLEELMTLKGIGKSMGQRIIDYRLEHGLFQTLESLMEVKGIGPKVFEKMREDICI